MRMPSPAVPARTAHSRPFFMSQIHPPRSATSEHQLPAGCEQDAQVRAPRAQRTRLCTVITRVARHRSLLPLKSSPRCHALRLVSPSSSHAQRGPPLQHRASWLVASFSGCSLCASLSRAVVVTSLHFMCVWRLGCARLCGSVGSRARARAARTSHAHILRVAHPFLQAQRSNTRHPLGDPFSASLRALMGEGVAFY